MRKKLLALLLAAVMLLACLAGCAKDPADAGNGGSNSSSGTKQNSDEPTSKYGYKASFSSLQLPEGEQINYIYSLCVSGDSVWFVAECITGTEMVTDEYSGETWESQTYDSRLFRMGLDGSNCSQVSGYVKSEVPEGEDGWVNISQLSACADGSIWLMENYSVSIFELPEDFDPETQNKYDYWVDDESTIRLFHIDTSGNVADTVELKAEEGTYINEIMIDAAGNIYANDYSNIYLYDAQGTLQGTIPNENYSSLSRLGDSKIGVVTWKQNESGDGSTQVLQIIDPVAKAMSDEEIPLPYGAYQLYSGFGEYDFLYTPNNNTFYGYDLETGTSEKLFSWLDCDVNSANLESYTVMSDGSVFALEREYDRETYESTYNTVRLTRVDRSELPEKQEIVLACQWLDYDLRSRVLDFNKAHDDIRIVVRDYSEYNTEEDYSAGQTKLITEILSGNAPDILYSSGMPISQFAGKGLLVDLWTLIDADAELSREDLMTEVFDAMSVNGKLYTVTDSFNIQTVVGKASVVGDEIGWTLDELMALKAQMDPEVTIFGAYDTKEGILQSCVSRAADSFVNWDEKKCYFDSEEFIDMLEFANSSPKEFDYEDFDWQEYGSEYSRVRNGKQLCTSYWLSSFDDMQYLKAMLGGDMTFIGYPSSTGNGNVFSVGSGYSIFAGCEHMDEAWAFVRELLLEENQVSDWMWEFPTNRNAFQTLVDQAMEQEYYEDPETGEMIPQPKTTYWDENDEQVDIYALSQEEYDMFMELYRSCKSVSSYNQNIWDIISSEVGAYFDGQKSAEETARLIQSRVSLYVMEQG